MFSLDDRAGNVVTTVALFMAAAAILYLARGAFLILLLSLLFAYLLEPAVTLVQRHSRLGRNNRTWAIAQVYLIGTLVLGSLGYEFGPHLAAQIKNLNAALPKSCKVFPVESCRRSRRQAWLERRSAACGYSDLLARHHDFIARLFERGAASAAYVAASAIWLFAIPILAIFILRDGRQMADAIIEAVGSRGRPNTRSSESCSRLTRCLPSTFARSSPWRASPSSSIASPCWF